jgi:ATP-dependent Lon protease
MDYFDWFDYWAEIHPGQLGLFEGIDADDISRILSELSGPDESPEDLEINKDVPLSAIPSEVAILPLRGLVVYPHTTVPLTIGQPRSIKLLDELTEPVKLLGLLTSRDETIEVPTSSDLYTMGTVGVITRQFRAPDGTIRIMVQGLSRFRVVEFTQEEPYIRARIELAPELTEDSIEADALALNIRQEFQHISDLMPSIPREIVETIEQQTEPLHTVYTVANFQRIPLKDAQEILEIDLTLEKLKKVHGMLIREAKVIELSHKIQDDAREEIEKVQREYFLREQMKAIQRELGEGDDQTADVEEFRKRVKELNLPEEPQKQAKREIDRLARLPSSSAEYGVIRTYMDWLTSIPWKSTTEDNLDVDHARSVLDQDHYGLKDVKERILEFLAVRKLRYERRDEQKADVQDRIRRDREGVILCFIGPPGVGKTSLGQSIARAMGRKFIRISLGGLKDEAEIRGHRRTYIGAMPGRIMQALRRVETKNPVFMLDEIDKLTADFQGDPASALLEVLDPEQNTEFRDNYIEVAYDLSQVMFITTANTLETIPAPLLDRMEVIQLSGYTEIEKVEIARRYLLPRQIRENGLHPEEIKIDTRVMLAIIRQYTREAGVRNLEREIGSICRKIAIRVSASGTHATEIHEASIRDYLGRPKVFDSDEAFRRTGIPGVATGLAWTPFGGEVLYVEATTMKGAKQYQITGSIGTVMQESAQAALSYIRSSAENLSIPVDFYDNADIHIHVPSGAQPKDGPSAGITIATALVSLLTHRQVKSDFAMTGEISLRGQVLPVGGIKEKMLAAHRAGIKKIILPRQNEADLDELPDEIRSSLEFILVDRVEEVIKNALETNPSS